MPETQRLMSPEARERQRVRAMYETMPWQDLVVLRQAFVLDLRSLDPQNLDGHRFITERIKEIDVVLVQKGHPDA